MTTLQQLPEKLTTETVTGVVAFGGKLDDSELLTGTPTVTDTTGDLTMANVAVNTAAVESGAETIAIGRAVLFNVAGGTAGTTYTLTVTAGTDASPAQTVAYKVRLQVT